MMSAWSALWQDRRPPTGDPGASLLRQLLDADGFDSGFARLEERAWQNFSSELAATLEISAGESVYEVGCGAGALIHGLYNAGHPIGGLDCSPALIELARTIHPEAAFTVADAADLDPSEQADVVLSMGLFLYFPSHEYAERVLDLVVAKARRAVAILDLPDLATRDAAIAERERVAGGAAAYAERYAGLDHQYYDRDWVARALSDRGLSRVETRGQMIANYGNAPFRFNAWGFKR